MLAGVAQGWAGCNALDAALVEFKVGGLARSPNSFPYRFPGVSVYRREGPESPWVAKWKCPFTGERRSETLTEFTDIAADRAREISRELAQHRLGLVDSRQQRYREAKAQTLTRLIEQYSSLSLAQRHTEKQVKEVQGRLEKVFAWCKFFVLDQFDADLVQVEVAREAKRLDWAIETANKYLKAVKSFCHWLRQSKLTPEHLGDTIKLGNPAEDIRHVRRALSVEEFSKLCEAAREGPVWVERVGRRDGQRREIDGPMREMIYLMAAHTGFRRSEIGSLTPESFDLEGQTHLFEPTVTVQAAHSKRRREDVQLIRADLAEKLREYLQGRPAGMPVFTVPTRAYKMIARDLRRAGIQYRTSGGVADFHCLRHTYITLLSQSGAAMRTVQTLARHSDPRLTARYIQVRPVDEERALGGLPGVNLRPPEQGSITRETA